MNILRFEKALLESDDSFIGLKELPHVRCTACREARRLHCGCGDDL